MEYIFIDHENIAIKAIPDHAGIRMAFIFAGEKQTKVSIEVAESMQKLGPKAKLIRMQGSGNNALDFHIAFYLGKYSEIDPKGKFRIVSKDKGFDPLVKHLASEGIDCARVESIAVKPIAKADLEARIADLVPHLAGLTEKVRPKKAAKLKAYIKNRIKEEDAIVDHVFDCLVADGIVAVEGGKVIYAGVGGKVAK